MDETSNIVSSSADVKLCELNQEVCSDEIKQEVCLDISNLKKEEIVKSETENKAKKRNLEAEYFLRNENKSFKQEFFHETWQSMIDSDRVVKNESESSPSTDMKPLKYDFFQTGDTEDSVDCQKVQSKCSLEPCHELSHYDNPSISEMDGAIGHFVQNDSQTVGKKEKCTEKIKIISTLTLRSHTKKIHAPECPYCHKVYEKYHQVRNHIRLNANQEQCPLCNKVFQYKCQLAKHKKTHTQCPYCYKECIGHGGLKHHLKKINHNCIVCNKHFQYRCQLSTHLETHKECPDCHKEYFIVSNGLVANFLGPPECQICNRVYQSKQSKSSIHDMRVSQKHHCPHCHKSFGNLRGLTMHLNGRNPNGVTDNHECDFCEQVFQYKCQLCRHLETHKQCPYCKKMFGNFDGLRSHLKRSRKNLNGVPDSHECELCEQVFQYRCQLQRHVETHRQCPHCHAYFTNSTILRSHLSDTKPNRGINCALCDSVFEYKCQLAKHLKTHKEFHPALVPLRYRSIPA